MYENIKESELVRGVEVGVWEGVNALKLLEKIPNLVLIGIDPYEEYHDWWQPIQDTLSKEYVLSRKNIHDIRMSYYIEKGVYSLIQKYSDAALQELEDDSYDFVYIDADHSYKWAIHDMVGYWKKVKPGGMLCGHDRSLSGVSQALAEFTKEVGKDYVPVEEPQQDSWYIIK